MPRNFHFPDQIFEQHVSVLGKTRSGKSSVLRLAVEKLLDDNLPVCIVDPKGDWWGLKLGKDGKSAGYPIVIFGGEHADVPINEHAGAHVAELFATGNRSCLIDLGGWMVGERTRFWIDFASTLFKLTKGKRYLVVDEIHNFAPKGKIMDPMAGKSLHWANRLASEGLGKGVMMLFASQRPQKVHNDTLTSAETLIAMRVLHPSDREAVADWVKGCGDAAVGREVLNSLSQMDRGEGWLWSPEAKIGPLRVKFPMFKTYDSFRPQSVEDAGNLRGWAEVDLEEVRAKMDVIVKEAEENDATALKAKVIALQKQLRERAPEGGRDVVEVEVEVEVIREVAPGWVSEDTQRVRQLVLDVEKTIGEAKSVLAGMEGKVSVITESRAEPVRPKPAPKQQPPSVRVPTGPVSAAVASGRKSGLYRILTALAQRPNGLTRAQIGIRARLATRSGTFETYMSKANVSGWVKTDGTLVKITKAGLKELGPYEPLPSGRDLLNLYLAQFGASGAGRILAALANAYPKSLSREHAAEQANLVARSGTFETYISKLKTLELVTGRTDLRASDELFA